MYFAIFKVDREDSSNSIVRGRQSPQPIDGRGPVGKDRSMSEGLL